MTMSVNRETILEKLLFGLGTVVTGPFYINGPDYDKSIMPYPYDPEAAALLKEAGWEDHDGDSILDKDGAPFSFEFLLSSGSRFGETIATILQENLKRVGIKVVIRKLEWAVFVQRIEEHNFDACTLAWSLGLESDPFQLWHSSQQERKGSNFVGFTNAEVDKLIEEARQELDPEKRRRMYHPFTKSSTKNSPTRSSLRWSPWWRWLGVFRMCTHTPWGSLPASGGCPRAFSDTRNPRADTCPFCALKRRTCLIDRIGAKGRQQPILSCLPKWFQTGGGLCILRRA